jgi:hypothetical protein
MKNTNLNKTNHKKKTKYFVILNIEFILNFSIKEYFQQINIFISISTL